MSRAKVRLIEEASRYVDSGAASVMDSRKNKRPSVRLAHLAYAFDRLIHAQHLLDMSESVDEPGFVE